MLKIGKIVPNKDPAIEIRRKGRFLSIKSRYKNKDEADRYISYLYYVETNDLRKMIDFLKADSLKINKEVVFETERLINEINNSTSLKRAIVGIIATILISYILWRIIE